MVHMESPLGSQSGELINHYISEFSQRCLMPYNSSTKNAPPPIPNVLQPLLGWEQSPPWTAGPREIQKAGINGSLHTLLKEIWLLFTKQSSPGNSKSSFTLFLWKLGCSHSTLVLITSGTRAC